MHKSMPVEIFERISEAILGRTLKGILVAIPEAIRGRIPGGVSKITFEEVAEAEVPTGGISKVKLLLLLV